MSSGHISSWNHQKGCGLIKSDEFEQPVFVHFSVFPENSAQPKIGDEVIFFADNTPKGARAHQVYYRQYNTQKTPAPKQKRKNRPDIKKLIENQNQRRIGKVPLAASFLVIFLAGYQWHPNFMQLPWVQTIQSKFAKKEAPTTAQPQKASEELRELLLQTNIKKANPHNFFCDGRKFCNQMDSLEEAQWFLENCPENKIQHDSQGNICTHDKRWQSTKTQK